MPVTRIFLQRIPFFRITGFFILGIVISHFFQFEIKWIAILLTLLLSAVIALWNNNTFTAVQAQNYLIAISIIIAGIFYPLAKIKNQEQQFAQKEYFLAEITQKPIEKAKTFQTILTIRNQKGPATTKVMAYFKKENFDTTLFAGDQLIIAAKPQRIINAGNPFEFDYQGMMHTRYIDFSVYLSPGTYFKTGEKQFKLIYQAELFRDKLIKLLSDTKIEQEELSVISALTLGYRAEIDPETRDYFASTGTMHVLAVSGLHVALIYLIVSLLFSPIKRGKAGTLIYAASVMGFLWCYAFITGFSPSVQRATIMFTFVIIGNAIRKPVNVYNSLSASALVLLLIDPNVVFDLGFQLSYLAVFGIVLLQPPLSRMIEVKNKLLKWIWELLTVSVAAQLATFPLGLLYFDQFPNLFWLSNLFIIPISTLVTWVVFVFFVTTPLPFIPNALAWLIQFLTNLMLNGLKWISKIPHSLSDGIVISPLQTWLIYAVVGCIIFFSFSRKKTWLIAGLVLFIFFQITSFHRKTELFNQKYVIGYNSPASLLHLINGRESYVINQTGNPITTDEMKMIESVRDNLKLEKVYFMKLEPQLNQVHLDLKINSTHLIFLNCLIKFGNHNKFKINLPDAEHYVRSHPELNVPDFKIIQQPSSETSQSAIIEFVNMTKTAYCLNLK